MGCFLHPVHPISLISSISHVKTFLNNEPFETDQKQKESVSILLRIKKQSRFY